jgi:hypothetical protein
MYTAGVFVKGVTDSYFVRPTTKVDRWSFSKQHFEENIKQDIFRLHPDEE